MPVNPTYPGVYIQEVDSGSRVVTGVATSITAFIGRASQGPANAATTVFDYGEFQKLFGGRTRDLPMTYAVEDFFNNGGSQAVIVRVCEGPPSGISATAKLLGDGDKKLNLISALRGTVANDLQALIVPVASADGKSVASYSFQLVLGPEIPLASADRVTAATLLMTLRGMTDWFNVDSNATPDDLAPLFPAATTADDKTTIPEPKSFAFSNGQDAPGVQAASFSASDLKITASFPGSWTDGLTFSIVPRGTAFVLTADHPMFAQPYAIPFATWGTPGSGGAAPAENAPPPTDLASLLAATKLFTLAGAPQLDVGKFVSSGISLTRIPDSSGSAAALETFGPLVLMANSPGTWGNKIGVFFDQKNITTDVVARFADYDITEGGAFYNVNVVYPLNQTRTGGPVAETIGPVYLGPEDAPCRIDHMLAANSQYLAAQQPVVIPPAALLPMDPNNPTPLEGGTIGSSMSTDIVLGNQNFRTGMYALDQVDLFNIMVIPPDPKLGGDSDMITIYSTAAPYCADHRAILIADPLDIWSSFATRSQFDKIQPTDFAIGGISARRSVFTYFPRVKKLDPEYGNREKVFSASGIVAGIFASTDVRRGVWKAPAGIEAGMNGVTGLEHRLTDMQNGVLNQVGVNVLRDFPVIGKVVWGSRTLAGADALSDDYKYLPVRRLTNYIEESLFRATKFAVFEPNAEPLWAQLRLTAGTFMADLNRQGAFYNYFVQCDKSTTTPFDIDRGRVNVIIAFAPVKPAEFVILTIQQLAGQTAA